MSIKGKGAVMDSRVFSAYGSYEDAQTQFKYRSLVQDYQDLQMEALAMKSRLEATKQKKLMLAAEVRFLQRKHKLLLKGKTLHLPQEKKLVHPQNSLRGNKILEEQNSSRKKARLCKMLPSSEQKQKKKRHINKKVVLHGSPTVHDQNLYQILPVGKEAERLNLNPDINMKESTYGAKDGVLRKSVVGFDLNQVATTLNIKEASLSSRFPIFDLNEISTGDEDILNNCDAIKLEDTKKNSLRYNSDVLNDLKLSICRNVGETSSHADKRKISWKDPVALRV